MDPFSTLTAALALKFIFFPSKLIEFRPSDLQIPHEEVRIHGEGRPTLHGWFFPGKKNFILYYLHGNAGNIGDRLDKIQFLRRLGGSIFILDYRGYGESDGTPTIEGVLEDSHAGFRYLTEQKKIPKEHIVLFGESLGGAMAVDVAAREKVGAVILESTFTSLRDLAKSAYPFVPSLTVPNAYRSVDAIKKIRSPLLVIHGENDEIVPIKMGKALYERAPQPKTLYVIPGARHNDTYVVGKWDYLKAMQTFLEATFGK